MSTGQSKTKILVVEDEIHIAEGLRLNLTLKGYDVKVAENGAKGLTHWKKWSPDLIVLDIMMPQVDGFTFLKNVRAVTDYLPIIVLSARFDIKDKVDCFANGVDDYLTKPFDLNEFFLRIERLLKKSKWIQKEQLEEDALPPTEINLKNFQRFSFGANKIDFVRSKAFNGQTIVDLTSQELKLLQLFFSNEGRPLSRKEILQKGLGYQGEVNSRTVDNFMVRFRKYFEKDVKNPEFFKGLRSVGYVFER